MGFDFLSQAAKFLQEQKNYKRWLAVFLCLAVTTVFGTAAALKMYGQAMTHQVKVLECQYEVHEHTDDCYEKDENGDPTGDPICGCADYVVHVHNDDCYDENGNLVCPLEEIELHEHDENCYEETEVLVCEEGESESVSGHQHTDSCYTEVQGELICEESTEGGHTHDDSCYSSELTCDLEEHTHDDGCYSSELACSDESEEHEHDDGCYSEELTCGQDEHTHGDGCYSETLTCGQDESTAHEHTDACYGTKKELTCTQGESESVEGHTHDDSCYETEETLTCEELELHTHVEALVEDGGCYDESAFDGETGEFIEGSRPVCGIPQLEEHVHTEECFKTVELTPEEIAALENGAKLHVHTEECYDEEGNLICTLLEEETEVHEHDANCYDADGNLTCGYEDAKDHEHDAKCYDEEGNLTCIHGGVKDHEHDVNCYDEEGNLICGYEGVEDHAHSEDCYDGKGNLICGYEVAKEHEHDANCYDEEGNLICGFEDAKDHEHDMNCYDEEGNLICGYEGVSDHVHTEECYDEEGNLICGYKLEEVYDNTRTYEGEDYIVTVEYNDDAEIPEEAHLVAEKITSEGNEEHYTKRDTEFKEMLDGANVTMKALLKVGFYLDGGEIEPKSPVNVTVQFLDENGLAEGKPITVVHFSEDGTEKLDGSDAENGSTTFKMESFSEIAIGYETDDVTIPISESYEYENDDFYTVFHIEGEVTLPMDKVKAENPEAEEGSDETNEKAALDEAEAAEEADDAVIEETSEESDDMVTEEAAETSDENEEEADDETSSEDSEADHDLLVQQLEFSVKPLADDSEEYAAFAAYAEENTEVDLSVLHVLSYTLSYEGQELDLSGCTVTALITPTSALLDSAEEYIQTYTTEDGETVENGLAINVYGQTETGAVSGLDGLYITENVLEEAENSMANYSLRSVMLDDTEKSVTEGQEDDTGAPGDVEGMDDVKQEETPETEEFLSPVTMKVQLAGNTFAASATSSKANPSFQVQYYAWLDRIDTSANADIQTVWGSPVETNSLIDTSGGILPNNKELPARKYFEVGDDKKIKSKEILTRIYEEKSFSFAEAPNLAYFDEITYAGKGSYTLTEIWVTDDKNVAQGTEKTKWKIYKPGEVGFTNRKETYDTNTEYYVLITEKTNIRLVYRVTTDKKPYKATFYDYDIGSGGWTENGAIKILDTKSSGINSASNCNAVPKYAFGNDNAGTNYGKNVWKDKDGCDNLLNAGNRKKNGGTDSYLLCTFGLVSGVDGSNLKFNVDAPPVFGNSANDANGEPIAGKSIYDDYKLIFERKGDTYTLQTVTNDRLGVVADNLDTLRHPQYGTTTHKHIWSNFFWPMDKERETTPAGHDFMFGKEGQQSNQLYDTNLGFPVSDDGKDHNSYFGMYYELTFDLSKDYVGPLEYYFFGDDDMWVFLDGQLVCDIGGVHRVVGEYVNLWDYLGTPNADGTGSVAANKVGEHKLQFFYTERGASGSTCWMQFTLPSVETKAQQIDGQVTNNLKVGKTLAGADIPEGLEYEFQINFKNNKGPLLNNYSYAKIDSKGNTVVGPNPSNNGVIELLNDVLISDGETFRLGDGEHIEVHYLPVGTTYTIKETGRAFKKGSDTPLTDEEKGKYDIIVDTGNGTNEGEVEDKVTAPPPNGGSIEVNYINDYGYALPETGGPGTEVYAAAGALIILLGAGFVYKRKFRERRV